VKTQNPEEKCKSRREETDHFLVSETTEAGNVPFTTFLRGTGRGRGGKENKNTGEVTGCPAVTTERWVDEKRFLKKRQKLPGPLPRVSPGNSGQDRAQGKAVHEVAELKLGLLLGRRGKKQNPPRKNHAYLTRYAVNAAERNSTRSVAT